MWWWDTFWPMSCGPTTPIWMFSCWHETFLWGSHLGDKTHSTWWQEDTRARTGLAYPAAPVKRWLEGRIMLHVTLWSQRRFNYDSVFSPSWLMCKLSAFYYSLEWFCGWTDWNWGCKSDFPMASQVSSRVQILFFPSLSLNVFIKPQDSFSHMSHSPVLQINLVQTQFYGLSVVQTNSNWSHKPWIST